MVIIMTSKLMLKKLMNDKNIPDEIFNIIYEYYDITQLKSKHINFVDEFRYFWKNANSSTWFNSILLPRQSWDIWCENSYRKYSGENYYKPYDRNDYENNHKSTQDRYEHYVMTFIGDGFGYNAMKADMCYYNWCLNYREFRCNVKGLKLHLRTNKVKCRSKCKTKKEMIQLALKI